jgi:transcriptional regulator of met regulon
MKKIKLKIVLKIKKILENQLTKINKISHNIQSDILLENVEKQKTNILK